MVSFNFSSVSPGPVSPGQLSPGRMVLTALAGMIILGALLLWSPWSHPSLSFLDALFVATSASCVTGLMTVPLSSFTPFGHTVIFVLMQIGGLGLVTMTVLLMSQFFSLKLSTRRLTGHMLEMEGWGAAQSLLSFIMRMVVVVELVGAALIWWLIKDQYPFMTAVGYALFHAVSSFVTAGITLLDKTPEGALAVSPGVLTVTAVLVSMGSLGFMVWQEIVYRIEHRKAQEHVHWSLQSKMILWATVGITLVSTLLMVYLAYPLTGAHGSISSIGLALANAITCRSAGFTTLHMTHIHLALLFFIMITAFIGSSPGSTGSGIKTTTFVIFLAAIRATIARRWAVEIYGRTVPQEQVFKAMAIVSLSMAWIAGTIFFLLLAEPGWRFIDIAFESVSAYANLGLTTGITPFLSPIGKSIIMSSMFFGRVGSLTLLLALKRARERREFHYPEERVTLG